MAIRPASSFVSTFAYRVSASCSPRRLISRSALRGLVGAVHVVAALAATAIAQASDTPGMSVRADLGPTPQAKSGEPDRVPLGGNPLWTIPLKELSNTRERPIFSISRRPPPPPVVETPYVPPPSRPPPPPPPEPLMLSLLGTIVGDSGGVALLMEKNSQEPVRLRIGESHQGWVLRSMHGREAMLEKDGRQETVTLPVPGDGAAAAAPAMPGALAMPGAPEMAAMPGAPAVPAAPATPGAQGTPPPGVPPETPVILGNGRRQNRR
jgi:general secretion pathway protein N